MEKFSDGGLLSEAYLKADFNDWCACYSCHIIFKDDIPGSGSVRCPNMCGGALYRGITEEQVQKMRNS